MEYPSLGKGGRGLVGDRMTGLRTIPRPRVVEFPDHTC